MGRRIAPLVVLALTFTSCGGNEASLPASWSRVFDDPALGGQGDQEMRAVVSTPDGLVAVGIDRGGGDLDAAVWTSPDGLVWSRVSHNEAVFGGPGEERMWDVIAGPGGMVAVGQSGTHEAPRAAVWISTDGATWEQASGDPAVFSGDERAIMYGVAAGSDGFVAVGVVGAPDESVDAAAWYSANGATWIRATANDEVFGGEGDQELRSVTWIDDHFVAVGYGNGGVVWTSVDGTEWKQVDDPSGAFAAGIGSTDPVAVVTGGPGLVAIGNGWAGDQPAVAVWTSTDGFTWTRVNHDSATFGGLRPPQMSAVASGPGGVIAVGFDGERDGASDVAIWTSRDGLRWTRVDSDALFAPEYQYAYDLAFYDGKVIVVGTEATLVGVGIVDIRAAVWVGE